MRRRHNAQRQLSRRRQRRTPRRHKKRGDYYEPMVIDTSAAARGIQKQLYGALFAAAVTGICALCVVIFPMTKFTVMVLVSLGVGSLSASIAMLMSARREELVHQLASDLHNQPQLEYEPEATDGTI